MSHKHHKLPEHHKKSFLMFGVAFALVFIALTIHNGMGKFSLGIVVARVFDAVADILLDRSLGI